MSRKELAFKAEINEQSLHKAIERNSSPSADTAVKIAKVLNVSVEYLVTGQDSSLKKENIDFQKYREYSSFIEKIDSLPEKEKMLLKSIVEKMTELEVK